MVVHDQSRCFLTFLEIFRINIVANMNFIVSYPSSSEHSIKRVLNSDINPPNKINTTCSNLPFNDFRLCSLDKSFILSYLFRQFISSQHIMRFHFPNSLAQSNSLFISVRVINEDTMRIFLNFFLDQVNNNLFSQRFSTETCLHQFFSFFRHFHSFFFQILTIFYLLLN